MHCNPVWCFKSKAKEKEKNIDVQDLFWVILLRRIWRWGLGYGLEDMHVHTCAYKTQTYAGMSAGALLGYFKMHAGLKTLGCN